MSPWLILLVIVCIAALGAASYVLLARRKSKSRRQGSTLILAGLNNAGKTCLLHQLSYQQCVETVTSMKENEASLTVGNKKIAVVDVPGHGRLRYLLDQFLPVAGAIVFVVDAASFRVEFRHVAEYLYELLTNKAVSRFGTPILVACNKRDVPTAADVASIKKTLLAELDELRRSRAAAPRASAVVGSSSSSNDDDDDATMLGTVGQALKWQELPVEVSFCECSAKKTESLWEVLQFAESSFTK